MDSVLLARIFFWKLLLARMPQNSGHTDGSNSIPWSFASARRVNPSVVPDAHGPTGILVLWRRMGCCWCWLHRVCFASLEEEDDDSLAAVLGLATVASIWVACWANADPGQMPRRRRASRGQGRGASVASASSSSILTLSNKYYFLLIKSWLNP